MKIAYCTHDKQDKTFINEIFYKRLKTFSRMTENYFLNRKDSRLFQYCYVQGKNNSFSLKESGYEGSYLKTCCQKVAEMHSF